MVIRIAGNSFENRHKRNCRRIKILD